MVLLPQFVLGIVALGAGGGRTWWARLAPLAFAAAFSAIVIGTLPDPGKLEYYASIGVTEVVLRLPGGDADRVLPILDEFAPLIDA